MDRFCRGCLIKYEEPTELLQYTEKNRRLFVYTTGIQVKRADTFTFQLCKDCYLNMKVACNFKKQCRNSDKRFKSYLGLKDTGESMDFSTFLKNNDDSWSFRFPGNSTPAYQKVRDEDNESTNTSIRNFMMDMMPDDDLPDTEARIIKEVIDEEADVLDDSLDSHWLQDDASIDTDFRLDFSFSPFSTPRPVNNDRYMPKKPTSKTITKTSESKQISNVTKILGNLDMPLIDEESNNALIPIKIEKNLDETMDSLDVVNEFLRNEKENADHIHIKPTSQCTIDRNLEEALKNEDNKEFLLDELLVSPRVNPTIQSPPTPLINNILFGDKLDMDENSANSPKYKSGQCIETFDNVHSEIEIIEEFSTTSDIKLDELDLEELKTEMIDEINKHAEENRDAGHHEAENQEQENLFSITNFYCKMCKKTFKSLLGLQKHSRLRHQVRIKPPRVWICDVCGRECNDRTNFLRHLQTHERPPPIQYTCDVCKMEFCSKNTLKQHRRAHTVEKPALDLTKKKYVCPECGAATNKAYNLKLHMRRHEKNYSHVCPECQKGFCRKAELNVHMRYHTGEKPFACTYCDKRFVRRDCLTKHIKGHLDLKPYVCQYCKSRFVNSSNLKSHIKKSIICKRDRHRVASHEDKLRDTNTPKTYVAEEIINRPEAMDCSSS